MDNSAKNIQASQKCHEALFLSIFSAIIFSGFAAVNLIFSGAFHRPKGGFYLALVGLEFIWPLTFMLAIRAIHSGVSGLRSLSPEVRKPLFRKTVFGILMSSLVLVAPSVNLFLRKVLFHRVHYWDDIFMAVFSVWSIAPMVMVCAGVSGIKKSNEKPWNDFHALDQVILYANYLLAIAGLILWLVLMFFMHMWDGFVMG